MNIYQVLISFKERSSASRPNFLSYTPSLTLLCGRNILVWWLKFEATDGPTFADGDIKDWSDSVAPDSVFCRDVLCLYLGSHSICFPLNLLVSSTKASKVKVTATDHVTLWFILPFPFVYVREITGARNRWVFRVTRPRSLNFTLQLEMPAF